ncbi:DUF5615 family PIN-like protein [Gracilimonas mengyeensis]|uniref:DUF5615 domain-containing protein n=1 Tax=Gracilimonas mengyeensis TaxID=1302730 RepID=A0A521BC83_9BACT|nr:DUF5615 family PIN-like protein [Gracilimonas mengyeensis]SMO44692.1 hypothetical protein SAMN06265219_102178 [Gracilimonas mengyeensis]
MKLLLDENLPVRLKNNFSELEVFTVQDCGWQGTKNGKLLKLMLKNGFDVLLTADNNIQNQQNFENYPIAVVILNVFRLTYKNLLPLIPEVKKLLSTELKPGPHVISAIQKQ